MFATTLERSRLFAGGLVPGESASIATLTAAARLPGSRLRVACFSIAPDKAVEATSSLHAAIHGVTAGTRESTVVAHAS